MKLGAGAVRNLGEAHSDGVPSRSRWWSSKEEIMLRFSLLTLVLGVISLPAAAMGPSTDATRCRQMMATYDRLVPEYDRSAGRRDRNLGEVECLKGNYAGGEKLLENALRPVGFPPVDH